MRRRTITYAALSVAVGVGLSACAGSNGGSASGGSEASKSFEVLAVLPITGPLATQSTQQINGLKASAEAVNKSGGIGGRHVVVKAVDDKFDPTQAVTLLQAEIHSSTPPDFVWAGASSNEAVAMAPILSSAKIVSGTTASSLLLDDPEKYPYHFGLSGANNKNYPDLVREAKAEGAKLLGFIAGNDALGTDNLKQIKAAAAAANLPLVSQVFDATSTDLTGPMDALRAKNPDFLVMSNYGAGAGYLLDARQKLGWNVPTIGDLAISASKLPNNANALQGVKIQVFGATVLANKSNWQPAEETAIEQITAQGPITTGATQPLYPYDAIQMLAAAAKQEGGTSADKLKAGLENLKAPNPVPWTMFANYGYTSTDHYPSPPTGAWSYIPAGEATNGFYQ